MDPYNLFTTADPTTALPWSEPSAVARELVGAIGTATAAVVFSAVVSATATFPIAAAIRAEIDPIIRLDEDPLMTAIWSVTADGAAIDDAARHAATEALVALREVGIEPERVLADPDGGVALYAFADQRIEGGARARYVRIAVSNDEALTVLCVDRESSRRDAWEVSSDLGTTLARVAEFLG